MTLEQEELGIAQIHCTLCDQDKPLDEFYPSGRGSETGQCKECVKGKTREREAKNVAEGQPKRSETKKKKPLTVSPEKLMEALSGGGGEKVNLRLALAERVLEMQQRTIELLVARSK